MYKGLSDFQDIYIFDDRWIMNYQLVPLFSLQINLGFGGVDVDLLITRSDGVAFIQTLRWS